LVFTGHEFAEGGNFIANTLQQQKIKASFFFTGNFYNNHSNEILINRLVKDKNFLGNHSDKHLLYCDWSKRDSLLVSKFEFLSDLFPLTETLGHLAEKAEQPGYTPGTLSHADYTTLKDKNYRNSETIYNSIIDYERSKPAGLNGFILLMHIGAGPDRKDKFYVRLPELIKYLKQKGYQFQTVDQLLTND